MKQVSPGELKKMLDQDKNLVLVDVRETWEHEAYNIGGVLIPLGELMARTEEIPKDKNVVVYCEKGIRSAIAVQRLEEIGFKNLLNLEGGMKLWKQFDNLIP